MRHETSYVLYNRAMDGRFSEMVEFYNLPKFLNSLQDSGSKENRKKAAEFFREWADALERNTPSAPPHSTS